MKKLMTTMFILGIAGWVVIMAQPEPPTLLAKTELKLTIPDIYSADVLNAINFLAGKRIEIIVRTGPSGIFQHSQSYSYAPKDPNESNLQFAERAAKKNMFVLLQMAKRISEAKRVREANASIPPIDVNVPADSIQ